MHTPFRQLQRFATFKEQGRQIKLSLHAKVSAVVLLLVVIPFTAFFLHPIIGWSMSFIDWMQHQQSLARAQYLFRFVSRTCSLWMVPAWSPVVYHLLDPRPGVKVIGVTCFAYYLGALLSMVYSEPRPYWLLPQSLEPECNSGYGMPSSELFIAIVFYFYLIIQVLRRTSEHSLTVLVYIVLVLCACFIGVGLVYLGENFPHQVLITASYAFVFLILSLALDSNLTRWFYKVGFNYQKNRAYSVYLAVLTILFVFFAIIFRAITSQYYLPTLWLENIANSKCALLIGPVGAFSSTSLLMYNLGVLTGSMHTHKYLHEFWWNTPRYKGFIRVAIAVFSQYFIYHLFQLINAKIFSDEVDETTNYVFGFTVPLFCAGYFLSGVLPFLFSKCGLTEPDLSQECTI